jgi:Rap guanine nucleotide exchange factor 1
LIEKLIYRYNYFNNNQNNDLKARAAKESFSLLVRVVNDLTNPDLSSDVMEHLIKFVYDIVCSGELLMAKLLRVKVIEKALMMRNKASGGPAYFLSQRPVMSHPPSLVELKSSEIGNSNFLYEKQS